MRETSLVLRHPLPGDAVELGRLILNVHDPEQDFYQPEPSQLSDDSLLEQRLENFSHVMERTKGSRVHVFLSSAFHASYSTQSTSTIDVTSAVCVTRQIRNSGDFFGKICKARSARRWLERAIRRRQTVYLVTGIKTLTDPIVSQGQSQSIEAEGAIQAPVTLASATAGVVLPGDILDVGAGASHLKKSSGGTGFIAPGEQIFAMQYRKIEFARFSSRDIDKAYLETGNHWEIYLGARGNEETSDIINANVSEFLQGSDLRQGESYENFLIDDEELFYIF